MIKKMFERKKEREILHEYMVRLSGKYDKWEPEIASGPLCEIYDRLERGRIFNLVFVYSFISIVVFVVNFFRRKP